ncbi:hypothetical protein [Actinoplanes sp. NPDC049265]|uniref:hypothetical protein n=1 Tax=Actinoplanes sp. NPDC049265 TaxID=3363902 RepID=UPI00371984A8
MTEIAAFHDLLLRLADRLPDDLTTQARGWLALGRSVEVARAVAFAALAGRIPVSAADCDLLTTTLGTAGDDGGVVAALDRSETSAPGPFALAPVGPDVLEAAAGSVPYSLDLTVPYDGPGGLDPADEAIRAAVDPGEVAGVPILGVWRSWRFPAYETPWPPPRRIFLVQADTTSERLAYVVPVLQDALTGAGEISPQIEVFADPGALPSFQRTALGFAALLWSPGLRAEIRIARVFDQTRPTLSDEEEVEVAGYLAAGTPLMVSPQLTEDVADPARGAVVPVAYHTDGRWVWPAASLYYLTEHSLPPDAGLLAHIRATDARPSAVDAVSLHRALTRLYATGGAEVR